MFCLNSVHDEMQRLRCLFEGVHLGCFPFLWCRPRNGYVCLMSRRMSRVSVCLELQKAKPSKREESQGKGWFMVTQVKGGFLTVD